MTKVCWMLRYIVAGILFILSLGLAARRVHVVAISTDDWDVHRCGGYGSQYSGRNSYGLLCF